MPQHSPGKNPRFEWHLPIELNVRHIKFPDIDKERIGVLLGTSCVQFTHALEWIRGHDGLRTELGWTIAGKFMHRRRTKSSFRKNFVLFAATEIHRNAADQFPPDMLEQYWSIEKKQPVNRPNPSFSPTPTTKPSKNLKKHVATTANVFKLAFHGKLTFTYLTITTPPSTVSVPSRNV